MERRCILTGITGDPDRMIRLGLGPDGTVVPDLGGKLPGRGMWISADRSQLAEAIDRRRLVGQMARSLKGPVTPQQVMPDLVMVLDRLLRERLLSRLGLEARAGRLVTGFEKVAARLRAGKAGVLITASDAADDGRAKLAALAGARVPVIALLGRDELSLALGRENVVHAAIDPGGTAARILKDADRLALWLGAGGVGNGADKRLGSVAAATVPCGESG